MKVSLNISPTFVQGTVPKGGEVPSRPALKLRDDTNLRVSDMSKTQCAAVNTWRGLTRVPVHHS